MIIDTYDHTGAHVEIEVPEPLDDEENDDATA